MLDGGLVLNLRRVCCISIVAARQEFWLVLDMLHLLNSLLLYSSVVSADHIVDYIVVKNSLLLYTPKFATAIYKPPKLSTAISA